MIIYCIFLLQLVFIEDHTQTPKYEKIILIRHANQMGCTSTRY
jgi:hypothetical protein